MNLGVSPEELNTAIECLKRRGDPITEESVREWFAQLHQTASPSASEPQPKPVRPKRKWHSWVPASERRGKKKRIVAPWYAKVARLMADGTPLKRALFRAGVSLTASEIRQLYYRKEFRALYQAERYLYRLEQMGRLDPKERKKVREQSFHAHGGQNLPLCGPDFRNSD